MDHYRGFVSFVGVFFHKTDNWRGKKNLQMVQALADLGLFGDEQLKG